jgi:TetR/AcrR family tetracycline transcriptional repressor
MKKPRTLNRNKVLNSAISILETKGLAKMSMRLLASTLDVQASAIYNHFKNKQELINALQAYYLRPENQKYPINYQARPWQEFLLSLAMSARLKFTTQPYVLDLFATHSSDSEESTKNFEKYLALMHNFGFSTLHAGQISQTIYVKKNNQSHSEQHAPVISKYPLANQFLTDYGWDFDRDFEFGIKTLIDGFAGFCNG